MPTLKGEFSWIFFIPAVILLGLTLFFLVKNLSVIFTYQRTSGEVVQFESTILPSGQTVYQTIARYKKPDGSTHEVGSFTKSSSISSKIGDKVTIYLDPNNPDHAHLHTFRDTWLHVLVLGVIGTIIGICWYGILVGVNASTYAPTGPNSGKVIEHYGPKEDPDSENEVLQ